MPKRERRRARETERRAEHDQEYIALFAARVCDLFPNCPTGRDQVIAQHACEKYSGRVGRSASAKNLNEKAILLAVAAHIRHAETNYDELLAKGTDRLSAREQVKEEIQRVLERWMAQIDLSPAS